MIFRHSSIDRWVLTFAFQAARSKKFHSPRKRKGQRGICPLQEEPVLRRRSRRPVSMSRQTVPPYPLEYQGQKELLLHFQIYFQFPANVSDMQSTSLSYCLKKESCFLYKIQKEASFR